jgi:hypothetical protein
MTCLNISFVKGIYVDGKNLARNGHKMAIYQYQILRNSIYYGVVQTILYYQLTLLFVHHNHHIQSQVRRPGRRECNFSPDLLPFHRHFHVIFHLGKPWQVLLLLCSRTHMTIVGSKPGEFRIYVPKIIIIYLIAFVKC